MSDCFSPTFLGIVAAIFLGQVLIVSCFGSLFNVCPLDFHDWIYIMLITSPILIVGEIVRNIKKGVRRSKRELKDISFKGRLQS